MFISSLVALAGHDLVRAAAVGGVVVAAIMSGMPTATHRLPVEAGK